MQVPHLSSSQMIVVACYECIRSAYIILIGPRYDCLLYATVKQGWDEMQKVRTTELRTSAEQSPGNF